MTLLHRFLAAVRRLFGGTPRRPPPVPTKAYAWTWNPVCASDDGGYAWTDPGNWTRAAPSKG